MMDIHTPYYDGWKHPYHWCATHRRQFDAAEWRAKQFTNKDIVGKYISHRLHTDVQIVGRVIGHYGRTGIVIQPMTATEGEWKREFIPGGFAGHTANQREQKWIFQDDKESSPLRYRLSTAFFTRAGHRMMVTEQPYHFYDYNF